MTDPERDGQLGGYLLTSSSLFIVTAFGLALNHHCRSVGGKEHCVIAADAAAARPPEQPRRRWKLRDDRVLITPSRVYFAKAECRCDGVAYRFLPA
jgi:hypothetical protein